MPLIRAFAFALLGLLSASAWSQAVTTADPWKNWQSADSAHFRVHYIKDQREQAERVSRAAERAYARITQQLNWRPSGRTEIILIDQFDQSNGYATPIPFNTVGVFLAPPDDGQLLDNSDWIEMLLMHELTHTVQLDKVRSVSGILRSIFGRNLLLFPNLFQPNWAVEGLAVYNESDPATGRGRLRGPAFEAWLRAESQRGFLSLRELNANGRSLPTSKSYLYGAYFQEYLVRRYGADAPAKVVERYSGNAPFWPRVDSSLAPLTTQTLAEVWPEFLADLQQQVKERNATLFNAPEAAGTRVGESWFDIGSIAAEPDGSSLAVLDDGVNETAIFRIGADGKQKKLTQINSGTQISVAPDGRVLLAQPDICKSYYLVYDLYRMDADGGTHRITSCARFRHAVWAGVRIVGLQQQGGATQAVLLDAEGKPLRTLWAPKADTVLVDIAASPDGQSVAVVAKRGAEWRVVQIDLQQEGAEPQTVFTHDAPLNNLHWTAAGIEFVGARDRVFNVWRHQDGTLSRLTHSHTGVTTAGATQADGSLLMGVVAPGGYELRRVASPVVAQRVAAASVKPPSIPAEPAPTGPAAQPLGDGFTYSALRSMYPRTWLPLATADQGLTSYGAATNGGDALGWHQYFASVEYETTQDELLGSFEYVFLGQHLLAFNRRLTPRAWRGDKDDGDVIAYDRETTAQWISLLPWWRLERRITFGIGAAIDEVDQVDPQNVVGDPARDQRIVAALVDYNTRNTNWWAEGSNRGQRITLLYEDYQPLQRNEDDYDGNVLRLDWRGYLGIGRSVIAMRYTEAKAHGHTERFQLGGATDYQLQFGYILNERDISLRGYRGDESSLRGANARVASVEFRTPLKDIDQHYMTPAVGINRLSGVAFFDIGGAWDEGNKPDTYRRGVGLELLAELKAMYVLGIQLRLGVARGLDEPKDTRGYLNIGHAF